MKEFSTCTVITRNRFAFMRVLANSIREHHPNANVYALVVDAEPGQKYESEPFTVVVPADVGVDDSELARRATMYTPLELTGSLRAPMLQWAVRFTLAPVLYFDCDIRVFGDLSPVIEHAARAGVLLSPHQVDACATGPTDAEWMFLASGTFNAGFVAVAPTRDCEPFLRWWAQRTARHCLADPPSGTFVEQRWLTLAPGFFDVEVSLDPGANLMGWRLGQHDIDVDEMTFRDEPVRFFHFCGGFNPAHPDQLATMPGLPWPQLNTRPGTAKLCRMYAQDLLAANYHAEIAHPHRYGTLPDGRAINQPMRRAYRNGLLLAEQTDGPLPPNAFSNSISDFMRWLATPAPERSLTRYLDQLWSERTDLQFAFPSARNGNASSFMKWINDSAGQVVYDELRATH